MTRADRSIRDTLRIGFVIVAAGAWIVIMAEYAKMVLR